MGATDTTISSSDAAVSAISEDIPLELDDRRGVVRLFSAWASLYEPLTEAIHEIILNYDSANAGYRDRILQQLQLCNNNSPLPKVVHAGVVEALTAAGTNQPADKEMIPSHVTKIWDDIFILEALRLISPILRHPSLDRVSIPTDDAAMELDRSIQGALCIRHQMFHGIAPLETERVSNCMRFLNTIAKSILPSRPGLVNCIAQDGMITLRWQTIVAICLDGMISLIAQEICRKSWKLLNDTQRESVIAAASEKTKLLSPETILASDMLEIKTLRMLFSPRSAQSVLLEFRMIDAYVAKAITTLNWAELQQVRNFVAHAHMDASDEEWIAKWPSTRDITSGIEQLHLSAKASKLEKALKIALDTAGFAVQKGGKLKKSSGRVETAHSTAIVCKWKLDEQVPVEVASAVFRVRITPPLVGREIELKRVLAACNSDSGNKTVLITGCSGTGKTALVTTAVHQLSQEEHKIRPLLLPGSSLQSAENALVWFGCSSNTIDAPEKQIALDNAKSRLEKGGWLVVIDSLADPAVLDLLPRKGIQVRSQS